MVSKYLRDLQKQLTNVASALFGRLQCGSDQRGWCVTMVVGFCAPASTVA